ncbi:glycosyltransferase family 2 protein [Microbacterium sp. LWH7-1.2]|jgi:hypothetical protein|uniref:glycosyltransferase family 2 protein n=1 Tax=Microbacterium sp. LWH7-1.2 TaxID=3135257 RepID=UPI003138B4CA
MTMMVRDEADIVGTMIEHHLDQGVDLFLVTDNGSVDGTREILEGFAADGKIELAHDPRHLKQQHAVVTAMAREAAHRGALWVLNADADEFWVAKDPHRTIKEELATIDPVIGAFQVPVIDMTGAVAAAGTGLQRLIYRDHRPDELLQELGIHAHATPDVAFVAREDVEVAQGNHFVDIAPNGSLADARGLEVYHFPWRSLAQFARKVENAGRAYEASPHLRPSANHHGMRDYRRLQDGLLRTSYIARHPSEEELAEGLAKGWFVEDHRIAATRTSAVADEPIPTAEIELERAIMSRVRPLEARLQRLEQEKRKATDDLDFARRHIDELDSLVASLREESDHAQREREAAVNQLEDINRSRVVRAARRVGLLSHL